MISLHSPHHETTCCAVVSLFYSLFSTTPNSFASHFPPVFHQPQHSPLTNYHDSFATQPLANRVDVLTLTPPSTVNVSFASAALLASRSCASPLSDTLPHLATSTSSGFIPYPTTPPQCVEFWLHWVDFSGQQNAGSSLRERGDERAD